jgi:hypothetical protein
MEDGYSADAYSETKKYIIEILQRAQRAPLDEPSTNYIKKLEKELSSENKFNGDQQYQLLKLIDLVFFVNGLNDALDRAKSGQRLDTLTIDLAKELKSDLQLGLYDLTSGQINSLDNLLNDILKPPTKHIKLDITVYLKELHKILPVTKANFNHALGMYAIFPKEFDVHPEYRALKDSIDIFLENVYEDYKEIKEYVYIGTEDTANITNIIEALQWRIPDSDYIPLFQGLVSSGGKSRRLRKKRRKSRRIKKRSF